MRTILPINLICLSLLFVANLAFAQQINKDEVYKNSFRPDLPRSMQDIPYQEKDYHSKHYSPYALVRLPKTTKNDKDILSPGFYLVKPWTENSVDYLIFKKLSQAVAVVPVINKSDLPKKVKKINAQLFEEGHGDFYVVTVNFGLSSYSARLDILK